MKPLRLELHNIGPFTGKTLINFEELGDIFLIAGKTGSGKTTILDALTYALYGRIPGARGGLNRNMLRSHFVPETETASVTLDFLLRDKHYRVERTPPGSYISTRKGPRMGMKMEHPEEAALYKGTELLFAKLTDVNEEIVRLIGLTSEEFSRIVLLPQGEFADFLRQNSNERRKSLSRLFPTEQYRRITEYALAKQEEYRSRLRETETQLLSLSQEFSADTWEAEDHHLLSVIDQTKERLRLLEENTLAFAARLESERALAEKLREKEKLTAEQAELDNQSSDMEAVSQKLEQAGIAAALSPLLHSRENASKRAAGAHAQLTQCSDSIGEAESELTELDSGEADIQTAAEDCRRIEFSIKTLKRAAELENSLTASRRNRAAAQEHAESLKKESDKAAQEIAAAVTVLEEISVTSAEIARLTEADAKAGDTLNRAKQLKELSEKAAAGRKGIADAEEALNVRTQEIGELEKACQIIGTELEELETRKSRLGIEEQAAHLAETLTPDSPCPVCGALEHPRPATHPALSAFSLTETAAAKKLTRDSLEKRRSEAAISKAGINARLEAARNAFAETEQTYTELAETLSETMTQTGSSVTQSRSVPSLQEAALFIAEAAAGKERTRKALDDAHRALSRREQAEQKRRTLESRLVPLQEELTAARTAEAERAAEIRQLEKQLEEALAEASPESAEAASPEELHTATPSSLIARFTRTLEEKQQAITEYRRRREAALSLRDSLRGRKEELEKNRQTALEELTSAEKNFESALSASPFGTAPEVIEALITPEHRITLEDSLEQWNRRRTELAAVLLRFNKELEGKKRPDIENQETELLNLRQEQQNEADRLASAVSSRDSLSDKKRRRDDLERKRSLIADEGQLSIRLADDLSGNNPKKRSLEAWILGVYLEEITMYASRRLERMSEGRYRLLLNSDKGGRQRYSGLDLEIFDSYTGRKRPCESLSGGETFMASISLALALTDAVQNRSGGIQLDAIFIDEGFGSLDDTTLEKALTILDEIRGSRVVGLISHVGELRNRIPVRLEVTKTSTGSTVEVREG
ncbi:MAG: AAA family ATPase [Spirochaetaceae bacterium]|jgi:exonuclease SbcC|nr:AAA family ATPase [Spirochaetaceae bacterium]